MAPEAERRASGPEAGEALLRRIARGDETALAGLFDVLGPAVLAIGPRRCATEEDVEGFVLGVFLSIWRRAPEFLFQDRSAAAWITEQLSGSLGGSSPGSLGAGRGAPAPDRSARF